MYLYNNIKMSLNCIGSFIKIIMLKYINIKQTKYIF